MKKLIMLITLVLLVSMAGGCNLKSSKAGSKELSIAAQYGLAYAPLAVMEKNKLLEKKFPDIKIKWMQLSNTASIREAMLSSSVDIGFMAIPPFLIGWDKGMIWKIFSGVSSCRVSLVTNKKNIKSIKDLSKQDKIALPQPGSVQHILLSMSAERELGNPNALDNQLVSLSHPDATTALLAKGDISCHFSTPPYLEKELNNPGIHEILDGKEIMGSDFTFVVGVTTVKFHDDNPKLYEAFLGALRESVNFINHNPERAAAIIASANGITKDEVLRYLNSKDIQFGTAVKGLEKFMSFMRKTNYITKVYKNENEVMWKNEEE